MSPGATTASSRPGLAQSRARRARDAGSPSLDDLNRADAPGTDAPDLDSEILAARGRRFRLRPIRTDDAEALVEMGLLSTPDDLRLRFFGPVRPQVGPLTTLLTQFDRDKHIAAAAYDPAAGTGDKVILGVVRLILAADKPEGEFAIMVRSDQAGRGLGHALMRKMLSWAAARGLKRVTAEILSENKRMLRLAREFGAVPQPRNQDFRTVQVAIDLASSQPSGPISPAPPSPTDLWRA